MYVLRRGSEAVVVDFGTGAWLDRLPEIGVTGVRHVCLTHAHRDQCSGLALRDRWEFKVHATAEDLRYYRPDTLAGFWNTYQAGGCPANYAAPRQPLPFVKGDVADSQEVAWKGAVFGVVPTPGHTRGAVTYVVVWKDKSVAFCGDAVHAGGRVFEPYHLEWDHWTAEGALAAWYGLERLSYCRTDLLCPSHGPVVADRPGTCVRQAQRRLMAFVRAKGSVCAGEPDRWVKTEAMPCGARRVLPDLYQFGGNSYLIAGDRGEGFVVDPTLPSIESVVELMEEVGVRQITAATASHYHRDHSDGLDWLRDRFGTPVWLHPWVAEPLVDRNRLDVPWLPAADIRPDRVLPAKGRFRWNRYRFGIRPMPGQTRWHCAFDTDVAGSHVLFSGDNYQPPSRWNGTGGFCAHNGSRFSEGFSVSAQMVLDMAPDVILNGHGCMYTFSPSHYRRILQWSDRAERAVREVCPSESWVDEYDCRTFRWEPFRQVVAAGDRVQMTFCAQNRHSLPVSLSLAPVGPEGWRFAPEARRLRVPAGRARRASFEVEVPADAGEGRHLIAAAVAMDDGPRRERAVALVDVRPSGSA